MPIQPQAGRRFDGAAWIGPTPYILLNLFRSSSPLLFKSLLITSVWISSASVQAAPATEAEMGLYSRIAAFNTCISTAAGVEFNKSVGIAAETISQLILGVHDGEIKQVGGQALSIEDLRKGSTNSAVIGAAELCPKQVPEDVKAKVKEALSKAQS